MVFIKELYLCNDSCSNRNKRLNIEIGSMIHKVRAGLKSLILFLCCFKGKRKSLSCSPCEALYRWGRWKPQRNKGSKEELIPMVANP